jgi:hypothetical protein
MMELVKPLLANQDSLSEVTLALPVRRDILEMKLVQTENKKLLATRSVMVIIELKPN